MATAAPSATAAPTPTAAPAAPPAEAAPARKIAPVQGKPGEKTVAPPDPVKHQAAPSESGEPAEARPKGEVLPGVIMGDSAPELPIRGPDGKFMSRKAAEEAYERELRGEDEGEEPTLEAGPAAEGVVAKKPEPPPSDASQTKIKFLGKEMTVAEVEQVHRTLQGMTGPTLQKLAQAEKDRDYGYATANGWEQEYNNLKAEHEALLKRTGAPGKTPGQAVPAGQLPADGALDLNSLIDGIDYDAFELIAHDPAGGTKTAGKYLASQILNTVATNLIPSIRAEIMKELGPTLDPVRQGNEYNQTAQQLQGVIDTVATYQTLDGQPAFPELSDGEKLNEIGLVWHDAGLPAEYARTQQGLMAAIALWRMIKGMPSAPNPVLPQPPAVSPVLPGPGVAAMAEGGGGPHVGLGGSSPDERNLSPEARNIRRALSQVETYDKTLGFRKNRPSRG